MGDQAPAVRAERLTKSYGRHHARGVVDVDLTVARGEVLGLVGANGAGKTTLMRTMLDFIRPTAGSLRLFGLDSVADSVAVRRRVAYLPGELGFPARLTGHQTVARFGGARRDVTAARVAALATALDLDLDRRVGDLSKGNKQKLGLLLAFAPRAELLVLDEPTSGLDPLMQRQFAAMVREAVGDGAAVLLSSHVMSEVEQIAARVALMRDGRVVTVQSLAQVMAHGRRRGRARPRDPLATPVLVAALRATAGVSEVTVAAPTPGSVEPGSAEEEGMVTFACTGDPSPLVATLATVPLASLDLGHADLEDAFFFGVGAPGATDEPDATGGAEGGSG